MMGPLGGAAVGWGLGRGRRRATPWWYVAGQTCVAAYQAIGAPSLAESYVNLAQPGTYDAAPGVAPTFDSATGWTFDGANDYLTTGYAFTSTAHSMILCYSNYIGNALTHNVVIGAYSTGDKNNVILLKVNKRYLGFNFGIGGARIETGVNAPSDGVVAMTGDGNGGYSNGGGYLDNVFWAWGGVLGNSVHHIFIGAENYMGTPQNYTHATVSAIAIYSTTLSASDVAALTARMQAL